MLEERSQKEISYQSEYQAPKEDKIEFDWTDIVAFTIATFQVLLPYVVFIFGGMYVIMFLLSLIFK